MFEGQPLQIALATILSLLVDSNCFLLPQMPNHFSVFSTAYFMMVSMRDRLICHMVDGNSRQLISLKFIFNSLYSISHISIYGLPAHSPAIA